MVVYSSFSLLEKELRGGGDRSAGWAKTEEEKEEEEEEEEKTGRRRRIPKRRGAITVTINHLVRKRPKKKMRIFSHFHKK